MVREIQGPNNQPIRPLAGTGQGGVRSGYEGNKGGQGQSGKKAPEPEPEPAGEEDEEGHLDGDSFARKRLGNDASNFMTEERMPWEVQSDDRKRRLAESKQQRGTGPLSQARADARAPKGLPPRAQGLQPPAGRPQPAAKSPTGPLPPSAGRRVEAAWDANAAANSTLSAYQQLRERQIERVKDQEREEPDALADAAEAAAKLTGGQVLNRDAISHARKDEAPQAPATDGPSWRVEPEAAVRPAARAPQSPTGPLPPGPPAPRPAPPKLKTGSLGAPLSDKPAEPGRGATASEVALAGEAARREPLVRGPIVPQEAALAPAEAPRFVAAPEEVLPETAEQPEEPAKQPEEPVLEGLLAEARMLQEMAAHLTIGAPGSRVVCLYQVVDAATRKPVAGARLEFEPVQDDLLPVINGQTDYEGQYKGEGIPAGFYQVTVRSPGYIPQMQTHYIKSGEVDEGLFLLKKP